MKKKLYEYMIVVWLNDGSVLEWKRLYTSDVYADRFLHKKIREYGIENDVCSAEAYRIGEWIPEGC